MENSGLTPFKDLGIGEFFRAYDSDEIIEFTGIDGEVLESFPANCIYQKTNNDTSWNARRQLSDGQWVAGASFSSDHYVRKVDESEVKYDLT